MVNPIHTHRRADRGTLIVRASVVAVGLASNAVGTSPATAKVGFPSRDQLVERYVAQSGREVEPLEWFEALALWKSAVFCEAIYGRYIRGELGADDTRAAIYREGVEQWRHYEPWLEPLKRALGPVLETYPAVPPDLFDESSRD